MKQAEFRITDENDAHYLSHRQRGGGGFLYDGTGYTPEEFIAYVDQYDFGTVPPNFIVLHHTYRPSISTASAGAQYDWDNGEDGLSDQEIYARRKRKLDGIKEYYRSSLGWDRGPHLFIDDRYIWIFTPMFHVGIHAAQGNGAVPNYSIGIEVIGYYERNRWADPIAYNVGIAVAALKRRLGTFEYVHKAGAGGISSHRDYNKPTCPGAAITEDYYLQVLRAGWGNLQELLTPVGPPPLPTIHQAFLVSWERSGGVWMPERLTPGLPTEPATMRDGLLTQAFERGVARLRDGKVEWLLFSELAPVTGTPPAGGEPVTPDSPLLSTRNIAAEPVVRFILSRDCGYDEEAVSIIVWEYLRTCARGDLDPAIAIAQMLHETGNLTSFWSQPPRHNMAGIGVTGQVSTTPAPGYVYDPERNLYACGVVFPTLTDGITAHCGRLLAYALPEGVGTNVQNRMIDNALTWRMLPERYRGCAPTLAGLAGTWATDQAYAEQVARKANEVLGR